MNLCLFLRCDVFFLGTAFSIPSHISAREGNDGMDIDGNASAANGVGSNRNGCAMRCRSGRFTTGRTGPLRAGRRACHSGGSGRASAIVNKRIRQCVDVPAPLVSPVECGVG